MRVVDVMARSDQRPVTRSIVSANPWFESTETYTFLWYLTLVSTNLASSNLVQKGKFSSSIARSGFRALRVSYTQFLCVMIGLFCLGLLLLTN